MRLLIVTAVSMSMLIPDAFAQSNSSSPASNQSNRTAATEQSAQQQHPEWFKEPNAYRPCPWSKCPAPPPQ